MKILYCIAGMGFYGVLESDILERRGFAKQFIVARRIFSLEVNPASAIKGPRGETMSFTISTYEDVMMNCAFICKMPEKSPFYKGIVEIVEKEVSREN